MKDIYSGIKKLYLKHRQIISYLFFGACAAVVNTVAYGLLYHCCNVSNTASTVLAWLAAVIFAFFSNKFLVFRSKRTNKSEQFREAASFFGCRILTGILDVAIMAVSVDHFGWNGILWKILSNVIITILNYVASKLWIFRKR